jgi:hypothetical protein
MTEQELIALGIAAMALSWLLIRFSLRSSNELSKGCSKCEKQRPQPSKVR